MKALDYLKISPFSRDRHLKQLKFEGFTPSQAEYGARAVGY
ncbi:Ltp family lipoprotein [Methanospirillum sp.]